MKRTLLQQAMSPVKFLDNIRRTCAFEVVQGSPMPNFSGYVELVTAAAAIMDSQVLVCSKRCTPVPSPPTPSSLLSTNWHDFQDIFEDDGYNDVDDDEYHVNKTFMYDPYPSTGHNIDMNLQELQVFHAYQQPGNKKFTSTHCGISLDRATWHNLPSDDKEKWDLLSLAAKNLIIQGTRMRGAELSDAGHSVKPAASSPFYKVPPTLNKQASRFSPKDNMKNNRGVSVHDVEPSDNPTTIKSNSHCNQYHQDKVEEEHDHTLLVN